MAAEPPDTPNSKFDILTIQQIEVQARKRPTMDFSYRLYRRSRPSATCQGYHFYVESYDAYVNHPRAFAFSTVKSISTI